MGDSSSASDDPAMMEDDDSEVERVEVPKLVFEVTHEAKLRELLHKINSIEIKLCSDAKKQFIKLLKGDSGGQFLRQYVRMSSNFSELMSAWKLRQGKPGMSHILSLISVILSHPDGKYNPNDKERNATSRVLDKFARSLIEGNLEDLHKNLNSKEGKCQSAALLLMASLVRRGSGLASEVAKNFNFKIQGFSKLAEYRQRQNDKKMKYSTRKAFVGFAMSFLEVGKPGLLRWILQQKEMYSGVLRGLGNDDEETVAYVLSTLRDRVLTELSLVPPGLRSVLFGSVTLEQLVSISGMDNSVRAAKLAHDVLVMVCNDPCNGLMPDLKRQPHPLRGNPKRLLVLMKKLKATEVKYHRDLLLAIVKGRPFFGSLYLEEFPYNLEDYASPAWFATISLVANLIASVNLGQPFDFLNSQYHDPPSFDAENVQSIVNCISPRPLSRSVINKGLLHSEFLVKNGTLRLLLEALKLLDSFLRAIDFFSSGKLRTQRWAYLKQEIQNEICTRLPDPQVLLNLLSALSSHTRTDQLCLKRPADQQNFHRYCKKLKKNIINENTDIVVGGMSSAMDNDLPGDSENVVHTQTIDEADDAMDISIIMSDIWDTDLHVTTLKDAEIFFHTKLLDALRIYLLRLPGMLEGSFDFFMSFLSNPLALPSNLQSSLLSLLAESVRWSPTSGIVLRTPPHMYKHLQPFINLLVFSPIGDIKAQAYYLARAAMSSTGAFDNNLHEIVAWLFFIPGYDRVKSSVEAQEIEILLSLSPVVISFLCDAVSTVANNLFKYWDIIRNHSFRLEKFKDASPDFSPLIICVLQKCVRVLNSESGTFTLAEKSMISLYVCSTLKYLLQTQEDAGLLSALIRSIMFEGLRDHFFSAENSVDLYCEWRPVKNLLMFAESILNQETSCFFPIVRNNIAADCSFTSTLGEVKKHMECNHDRGMTGVTKAFCSAMICTTSDGLLESFPLVMTMSQQLQVPVSFLASIMFLEQHFLDSIAKLWPNIFSSGLEMATSISSSQGRQGDDLTEEIMLNADLGIRESVATAAFSLFLRRVPFDVLFPAIICTCFPHPTYSLKVKDLLLAKISEAPNDCLIHYLRLVLFWFYQIQSRCVFKLGDELGQCFEICCTLVKNVLAQFFALKPDSEPPTSANFHLSTGNIQEVAKTIFSHPSVIKSLACPLSCSEFNEVDFADSLEAFASASRQRVHSMDHLVLDLLTMTFDNLLSSSSGKYSVLGIEDNASRQLAKVFNIFIQRLTLVLKEKLDLCIRTKVFSPLLPTFYTLHALIQYISPFELLEVVRYIFDIVDVNCLTDQESYRLSLLTVGFCVAGDAFNNLSNYLLEPTAKRVHFFWKIEEKNFDINLVEEVYLNVCKFATKFELDSAYNCLQKAVNVIFRQKQMRQGILRPLILVLSRIILSTPIHILSHCIYRTSMTKASLLFLLVELSTLHCSVFGHLYLGILKKDCHHEEKHVEYKIASAFSDEKLLMLLPPALSYLNSIFVTLEKQYYTHFTVIPALYSKMLLNGFRHWKSFVSKIIFQENFGELLPSSVQELVSLVDSSLLGKAIHMLQYHFALTGDLRMKERLKLCNSVISSSCGNDELLDCDAGEMEFCSINKTLNLMNRVIAKISFCRMLLFGKDDQILSLPKEMDEKLEDICLQRLSNKEDQSRIHFMKILVATWQCIVKKFPLVSDFHENKENFGCLLLYRYLELFILRTILELIREMHDGLIKFHSIPFLEQLMRSSLLYRFEDPTTLEFLRIILTLLSDGKFSCTFCLQLLLSHSQFAPTVCSVSKSRSFETGAFVRPMSSILRSVVIPHPEGKSNMQRTDMEMKQLETVKLLRVLLHLTINDSGSDFGKDTGINLKELYLLLSSSYGATLTEVDLEMYNVMHEIESIDKSISEDVAEMDYLWGSALIKLRQERVLDQKTSTADIEALEEQRRSQFRENFPVDPKMCVRTVLHFPYDRTVSDGPLSINAHQQHNLEDIYERQNSHVDDMQRYDPVFILRFSIHTLSKGYVEATEFAGLGLLALSFISMSSPDVEMRKLGYEVLGRYKNALEKSQKKRDIMQLRLLLTYIQNGIEEPWQRIPSVIALFAAESSFILLDPSHDHYTTLSKHLMHSNRVKMKSIPLFNLLLQSSSVNFRTERLWMLRLVFAGLNLDDDAQIFIKNSIMEAILSLYASYLSDNGLKELILQTVKKAVKLPKMVYYLVERCGLFLWLSSVLSISTGMLNNDENMFSTQQLIVVTEIVADVVSSRNIIEWLQNHALEQLMELTSHLHKLLVADLKLMKDNVALINSVVHVLASTLKTSQKRKIYQPYYTLSFEGLFQIYQAFDLHGTGRSGANAVSGLKAILMSIPPLDIFHMNQEKLSDFLLWSVSTALKFDSGQILQLKGSHTRPTIITEDAQPEESLKSKLLRWLVASAILGKLYSKPSDLDARLSKIGSSNTLNSLLENLGKDCGENTKCRSNCQELLAGTILYLQQLLGVNCPVLPSTVSALCLLLLPSASKVPDFTASDGTIMRSLGSKIRCPSEANPAWRWSYYQPWKDLSSEPSETEKMEERHACQTLLVMMSNVLGKKSLESQVLSHRDIENSGVFVWEMSIIGSAL